MGSSLGVIELTVALHYVFEAPEDKITWDVSHQVRKEKREKRGERGGGGASETKISERGKERVGEGQRRETETDSGHAVERGMG